MNATEISKLLAYAEQTGFGENMFDQAYEISERIHAAHAQNVRPVLSGHDAALMIKYQAMCLNGNWDSQMLGECLDWMKSTILYGMEDVIAALPVKRATKPARVTIGELEINLHDERFAQMEV